MSDAHSSADHKSIRSPRSLFPTLPTFHADERLRHILLSAVAIHIPRSISIACSAAASCHRANLANSPYPYWLRYCALLSFSVVPGIILTSLRSICLLALSVRYLISNSIGTALRFWITLRSNTDNGLIDLPFLYTSKCTLGPGDANPAPLVPGSQPLDPISCHLCTVSHSLTMILFRDVMSEVYHQGCVMIIQFKLIQSLFCT